MIRREEALEYHSRSPRGKIEIVNTKPCLTQRDLSLAYTPGVAEPCREIQRDPDEVFKYTSKGNLVAVVTNGTAVLGLGNIGPAAGKPVMEGKGVLFKRFADIDVFDIELDSEDPEEIVRTVKMLEPTFGGINLEDIKAPDCFYIEEQLTEQMNIPVFHDDQHGTAIISAAAFLNAMELVGKDLSEARVVFCGAGAAGIACADLYLALGVKRENVIMVDTKGVIYKGRTEKMNPYKERFAIDTSKRTLDDAMEGADAFVGVSVKGLVTQKMLRSMNDRPIVFAMANPDPEITYPEALKARDDVIMATGRSDFPNQVNNVLGFPFIFRGALDVRAKKINMEMKVAAVKSLADLAKEDVPDSVYRAYGDRPLRFGPEYIIPKPFDPRVLIWEAAAVAQAAIDSGVAIAEDFDIERYPHELEGRLGRSREIMRVVMNKAMDAPKRIAFPEGDQEKIIRAARIVVDTEIARPILLGNRPKIEHLAAENNIPLDGIEIVEPRTSERFDEYVARFYRLRERKGITESEAVAVLRTNRTAYGAMMVRMRDADGLVSGLTQHYPDTIRPALQIIETRDERTRVAGLYMLVLEKKVLFFADTTVNIDPSAEDLAEIAICAADTVKSFDIEPRVAMLSFSNFGSTRHPHSRKVAEATSLVKARRPDLVIDGEMQVDYAVNSDMLRETYPFSSLPREANVLIFPDLQSGNIAYKLMWRLGGAEAIGPILMGMRRSVHVLQRGASVEEIVNMTAIAVVDAQAIGQHD